MIPEIPEILDLDTLREGYRSGRFGPMEVVETVVQRVEGSADPAIFISLAGRESLFSQVAALIARCDDPGSLPLWGIPFAVKDNIDAQGFETTAGCPSFAYRPERDATVVARLRAAGAILVGKTNLDQFATGLNGTRSPFGAPRSVFDPAYISGGSSSGSAVAVASGLVTFALGTDTAGSGRVPAMMNNLVGIKPTPGLVPNTGVVPACASIDCVTIFAASVSDGAAIRHLIEGPHQGDPFSRPATPRPLPNAMRLGILAPHQREFFGNDGFAALYERAIEAAEADGATLVPIDYAPFAEAASLLYGGPWVAERLAAIEEFFDAQAEAMNPVVRDIIGAAKTMTAVEAFKGQYALARLKQAVDPVWQAIDALLLPTAPTTFTVEAMQADPVALNSRLGHYTNFVNLLGYCAIAVPAGFSGHLPFGVTLVAPGFSDDALVPLAARLHRALGEGLGRDRARAIPPAPQPTPLEGDITLAVVGAHLSGMPLNRELLALGARPLGTARTAPHYRLHVLPGTSPAKPGLVADPDFAGPGLDLELYALPAAGFGHFVAQIPAPLGIGRIALDDGRSVSGFLCEAHAVAGARDITGHGGWRAYVESIALSNKETPS